jgi:hypothetical protein
MIDSIDSLDDLKQIYINRFQEDVKIREYIVNLSVEDTKNFYSWYYKLEPVEEIYKLSKITVKKLVSAPTAP